MSWPIGNVSDLADVISGYAFKSTWFGEGSSKVIRIGDLKNGQIDRKNAATFDEKNNPIKQQFKIKSGDILMAMSGATVGKIAVATEESEGAYLNQRVVIIRSRSVEGSDYLKYVFSGSYLDKLLLSAGGAAQPNLSPKDLASMEIPLPPLAEQKRIAAILDKADAIRRKRQQAIKLADDFLRSVFLDMFGDPVKNTHNLPTKPWSEVLKIINGRNQKKVQEVSGKYPIMGSGGEMGRANDYLCPENTVIIGRKGNINKPILVKEKFWNVDTAFGLSVDDRQLSYNYLFWFCKFFNFERLNKTVTIPSLTKSDLLILKIPLPSIKKQKEFDAFVKKMDALLDQFKVSKLKLNNNFNSLSQKAFAGEL